MKDIINNKKMLYVGIAILVIGIAFAIGTYAYYSTTITGTANGQVLAYTCTGNNTTNFTLDPFANAYPGYSATRTISLNASIYTEATINVSSYTNMGVANGDHANLAIYSDSAHTKKMSNGVNTITTTITPGTATDVPIYIYWPYNQADTYSTSVPSATITITCNQGVSPADIAATKGLSGTNMVNVAGATRYVGSNTNVHNYVSFNNGELWRIIGIYDGKLKIIKATSLTDLTLDQRKYNLQNSDGNAWAGSNLETYLNDETNGYYSTLDVTAKNMIVAGTWNAGAAAYNANASEAYTTAQVTQVTRKVGLIATYEYLYAADSSCYPTAGHPYTNCTDKSWLKPVDMSWTLTPFSSAPNMSLIVHGSMGSVQPYSIDANGNVRPVVYLNSNVKIMSGEGTDTQPYVLG